MDKQALITLRALSGDTAFAEREINLDPNNLTIRIGRASKTPEKGLLPAVDNAWFVSPVMSRDHAEMCFNPETNVITIHDLESMHGTFLNNDKLHPKEPTVVKDGDELSFGAEVSRGVEVFSPCTLRVSAVLLPYKAPNSYTFPDSSDIEEEEEDNDVSDDMMEENHPAYPSSEDDVSIELQSPLKMSRAIPAIDLTREDSPSAPMYQIDLTDEVSITSNGDRAPNAYKSYPKNSALVQTEDDEAGDVDCSSGSDIDIKSVLEGYCTGTDLASQEESDSDVNEDPEDSRSVLDRTPGVAREIVAQEVYDTYDTNYAPRPSYAAPDTPDLLETDYDDESDYGLSEAGAEGMKALLGHDLLHNNSSFSEHVSEKQTRIEPEPEPEHRLAEASSYDYPVFALDPADDDARLANSQPFRQPSPSDAAMVKTIAYISTRESAVDAPTFQLDQGPTSQTLGEKTGKHAFFEARENNKAQLNASKRNDSAMVPPFSAGEEAMDSTAQVPAYHTHEHLSRSYINRPYSPTPVHYPSTTRFRDLAPLADSQPSFSKRAPSPDYDMTSAAMFNESKAKSIRSKLSIREIIDSSSRDESAQTLGSKTGEKRKANEISSVIDEELREWASLDASILPRVAMSITENSTSTQQAPSSVIGQIDGQGPAKKLKTKKLKSILERVGYAAVGGMAVGAGLFFGLVATAPDFV